MRWDAIRSSQTSGHDFLGARPSRPPLTMKYIEDRRPHERTHESARLPGGEVEIALRDFGWGESCRLIIIQCVAPFAPPEKCFVTARFFRPPLRGDGLCCARL